MSQAEAMEPAAALWEEVVRSDQAFGSAVAAFLRDAGKRRVELVRKGLRSRERGLALRMLSHLSAEETEQLFPDLLRLASVAHGLIQDVRDAILALPRDWVLRRIELEAEPILAASQAQYQFEEYRRLLELYEQLGDHQIVERLARRAVQHADEDVREAGEDFLAKSCGDR